MKKLPLVAVEFAVLFALLEVAIRISVAPQIDVPHLRVDPHGFAAAVLRYDGAS